VFPPSSLLARRPPQALAARWFSAIALAAMVALLGVLSAVPSPGAAPPASAGTAAIIAVDTDVAADGVQPTTAYRADASAIDVDVVVTGADAIGAFEFEVFFDPSLLEFLGWEEGPFLGSTGRATACGPLVTASTVLIGCGTSGPPPPLGATGDGTLARLSFRPRSPGEACLLLLQVETASVFGDALPTTAQNGCLDLSPDSDGDGCSNHQEMGTNPPLGGMRDPADRWDFYDVPAPALGPADVNGVRDRAVSLSDALAVLAYVGTRDGGPPTPPGFSYNSDLNANGIADGREYDRTPSADPAMPWRSRPPNGAVSLQDAMTALSQVGHSCKGIR